MRNGVWYGTRKFAWVIGAVALLCCITAVAPAQAPGTVDTSFGGDGFISYGSSGSQAMAMTVDSAGRVIVVGGGTGYTQWVVARFLPDGSFDPNFNQGAPVLLFGQNNMELAMDVAIQTVQNEERIVVVGLVGAPYDNDFAILRLKSDGSLDPSFGTNGVVRERLTSEGCGSQAVAIQSDGKIVVAGFSFSRQNYAAIAIARYTIDGSLDVGAFGPPDKKGNRPGYIIDEVTSRAHDAVHQGAIAIQSDGKIVVGGFTGEGSPFPYQPNYGWTVARYNADGTTDTGFGSNGKITETTLTGFTYFQVTGVGLQSNGKVIATGRAWNDYPDWGTDIVALRYSATGSRDIGFGVNGLARTGLPDLNMRWNRLGIQPDDKIVVGAKQGDSDPDLFVFRFNADGTPDTSFGTGGRSDLIGNYPGSIEWACSLALGPDGGIFIGGGTGDPIMAVAKIRGDLAVTTPPLAPTGLTAAAVSPSQIDLAWTDNASTEVGFKIERSPNGVTLWEQIVTVGADVTTYEDTGLDPETTYYYRVRAYNVIDNSDYSNPASDSTPAILPPAAPTGLGATAVSSSQINLAWTDNASDEDGFRIEKLESSVWTTLATVAADVTSYQDTGLDPETLYSYRVCAYNLGGDSGYSNIASDTTQASATVDHFATGDIPVTGTVDGSYSATTADDDTCQKITEVVYDHRLPKQRYNYLEHQWTFNVQPAGAHVFHVQAYRPLSADGDDFVFAYSTDGSNFIPMVTVSKTDDDNLDQTFVLPSNLSGTVYVRVTDTDRSKGLVPQPLDTIHVDHMFIRSE